ncbi:type II secretion system F family protein [Paraglaciecola sp.]|uniref:type II secretion system F family protein n=1 Tax=Paraglaciecola sp. TaxID=1920173 RepID=UPI0030F47671
MKRYHYRAVTEAGEIVQGELDANSAQAITDRLLGQRQVPMEIHEIPTGSAIKMDGLSLPGFSSRVSRRQIGLLTHELSTMLNAGLTLEYSLELLEELAETPALRDLFQRLLDRIRRGVGLAEAFVAEQGLFPPTYTHLVRAGEISGSLPAVMARLTEFLVKTQAMRDRVMSALIYPTILLIVVLLTMVLLLTVVLPRFESVFLESGADLPYITQIVLSVGNVLQSYWWLGALILLAIALAGKAAWRHPIWRRRIDNGFLHAPFIGGLITKSATANLTRTLGTLIANGISLPVALSLSKDTLSNQSLRDALDEAARNLKEGSSISASLAKTGYFPKLALQLIRVGEETGKLEDMMVETANLFERETQVTLDRLLSLLVPVLTLGMGVFVALLIGSVLIGLLSVNDMVR